MTTFTAADDAVDPICEVCRMPENPDGCGSTDCPNGLWADHCEHCGYEGCMEDTHG